MEVQEARRVSYPLKVVLQVVVATLTMGAGNSPIIKHLLPPPLLRFLVVAWVFENLYPWVLAPCSSFCTIIPLWNPGSQLVSGHFI